MEMNLKIIIGLLIIIVVLCIGLVYVLPPKTVDASYCMLPTANEHVQFSGTYLGPYDSIYNAGGDSSVIQVGNAYVIVSTAKLKGLEGQTVTVDGYFVNDKIGPETVSINGQFVNAQSFRIENLH